MNVDKKIFKNLALETFGAKAAGMSEGVTADGGYAVGTDVVKDIIDNIFLDPDYIGLVNRYEIATGKNKIQVPYSNDALLTEPTNGTRAYWTDEAATMTPSTTLMDAATLTLNKITTLVHITDELLYDVDMADTKIKEYSTKAIQRLIGRDILFGTNAIKGVFNDTVGTQTTTLDATPTAAQLNTAYNLLNPALINGAKWYVNQYVYTALFNSGYANVDKTMGKLTVLGLPVVVNPYLDIASSGKHILLGNFKAYALAYKTPSYDKGITLNFLSNQTAFRLVYRMAGDVVTAITACEDGEDRGAFIIPTIGD